jgi:thymidylate synthase (FAD)
MSNPTVYTTSQCTRYLKEPGVVLLSRPSVDLSGMSAFLEDLGFSEYLDDPVDLPDGTLLSKVMGQLCYMSFGTQRTWNKDADKYFMNVKSQKHGSIIEHPNYTFLLYGVSRSLTHEMIRHRSGFAYSQVSQRFVSGKTLRFVERPEYQNDDTLHEMFEKRIDQSYHSYQYISDKLLGIQKSGNAIMSAELRTDLRKKVNQAARSVLQNETESPIGVTGNIRAWRHFIEMRASEHAEIEIRALAMKIFHILQAIEPILFADYALEALPDGTSAVRTEYRKV